MTPHLFWFKNFLMFLEVGSWYLDVLFGCVEWEVADPDHPFHSLRVAQFGEGKDVHFEGRPLFGHLLLRLSQAGIGEKVPCQTELAEI